MSVSTTLKKKKKNYRNAKNFSHHFSQFDLKNVWTKKKKKKKKLIKRGKYKKTLLKKLLVLIY